MSKETGILWTDHTWNPWASKVRRTKTWKDPERWNEEARLAGRIEKVFTCSLSDFFHERADAWRPEAWELIRRCPHLNFQVLTKRPLRIAEHLPPDWGEGYPNVWLGVSIESNDYVWRADVLRQIPTGVRWISAEPLLGPLPDLDLAGFQWIVVSGESGSGFREMDHAWARHLRDKAKAQGTAFYFKQSAGARAGLGDLLDGRRWREFPAPTTPGDQNNESGPLGAQDAEAEASPSVTWEQSLILTPRVFSQDLRPISTSCLDDPMLRADWWNEIEYQLELMVDLRFVPDQDGFWSADGREQVCKFLEQKVPRPTTEEWEEYRLRTEERYRTEEEERRRQEEERSRAERVTAQLREENERLQVELRRQQQEVGFLRAEVERQRKEAARDHGNWRDLWANERAERTKAEQAARQWERLADEQRRQAATAWALYWDLLTGRASAGFARQSGSGASPSTLDQDLTVLGLTWPCTREEVKKAYRRLAMKFHPDRNPGDKEAEAKFKKMQAAYDRVMEDFDQGAA